MTPSSDNRLHIASLVQAELEARRIAISRELATIPPPVPACDVDFNRLLEDRGRIADDSQCLNRMLASGESDEAILSFCRDSLFLSDAVKREITTLLAPSAQEPPLMPRNQAASA